VDNSPFGNYLKNSNRKAHTMTGDIRFKILNSRIDCMTEEIRRLRAENRQLRHICDIFDYTPGNLEDSKQTPTTAVDTHGTRTLRQQKAAQ
jgi:hypothetical protein